MIKIEFNAKEQLIIFASKIMGTPLFTADLHLVEAPNKTTLFYACTLPAVVKTTLKNLGISWAQVTDAPKTSKKLTCLAEAIPTEKNKSVDNAVVLFMPRSKTVKAVDLANELLRLGCDRQEICFFNTGPQFIIKAIRPSYYTISGSLDDSGALSSFVPVVSGQEKIWVEYGYAHKLGASLQVTDDKLVLILRDSKLLSLADGPWTDIYTWMNLVVPQTTVAQTLPPKEKFNVQLTLEAAQNNRTPNLWLVDDFSVLDSLVDELSEAECNKWLFSVATINDVKRVLLLPTRGQKNVPQLNVCGEPFNSHKEIDNLYLPKNTGLRPQLTTQTVKNLLADNPNQLTWVRQTEQGLKTYGIDLSSFTPLNRWINYVFDAHANHIQAWVQSVSFDIAPYISVGCEWHEKKEKKIVVEEPVEDMPGVSNSCPAEVQKDAPKKAAKRGRPPGKKRIDQSTKITEEEQKIRDLERDYIENGLPVDSGQKIETLAALGQLYVKNNAVDANLCLTRVVWENPEALDTWVTALKTAVPDSLETIVNKPVVTVNEINRVVAELCAKKTLDQDLLYRVQNWLADKDYRLDVRSIWLAARALSDLTGGDKLLLARARDKILSRLMTGLSLEKDVPTFIRFCRRNDADVQKISTLTKKLDAFYTYYNTVTRQRTPIEAAPELTNMYVNLIFAYGYAKLGDVERAKAEQTRALKTEIKKDALHNYLLAAFCEKVDQAVHGQGIDTPLSVESRAQLSALEKYDQYKANRLRQVSLILAYTEHIDPAKCFYDKKDDVDQLFLDLFSTEDAGERNTRVTAILEQVVPDRENVHKLVEKLLDAAFTLGDIHVYPIMNRIIPIITREATEINVLATIKAITVCGFFSKLELVNSLTDTLVSMLNRGSWTNIQLLAKQLNRCIGSLRRMGLTGEALQLLETVSAIKTDNKSVLGIITRTYLSQGFMDLNKVDVAKEIIDTGMAALTSTAILVPERLELIRALALSLGSLPEDYAFSRLEVLYESIKKINDSYNTNSHFCLSILNFVESIVLGYTNDKLSMGAFGKTWLADDEYLVRKRLIVDD